MFKGCLPNGNDIISHVEELLVVKNIAAIKDESRLDHGF